MGTVHLSLRLRSGPPTSRSIAVSHSQTRPARASVRITLVSPGCEAAARRGRRRGCPRRRSVATVDGWPCGHLPRGRRRSATAPEDSHHDQTIRSCPCAHRSPGRVRLVGEPIGAFHRRPDARAAGRERAGRERARGAERVLARPPITTPGASRSGGVSRVERTRHVSRIPGGGAGLIVGSSPHTGDAGQHR